jgi:hypothetical protein
MGPIVTFTAFAVACLLGVDILVAAAFRMFGIRATRSMAANEPTTNIQYQA